MYVILTSKPGQFRTEIVDGMEPVQVYDYVFYGRTRARFTIAALVHETKVRLVEETEPVTVNLVPTKFLERFATIELATQELRHLCAFGDMDAQLRPVELGDAKVIPAADAA